MPRKQAKLLAARAVKAWRRALRRGHGADPEAWFGLGTALAYLGDSAGAAAALWRVLDILPTFWAVYFRLGALLEKVPFLIFAFKSFYEKEKRKTLF